jgi:AAA+ superfamily predicted ATPase
MSDVTFAEVFAITANATALQEELDWLGQVITARLQLYFEQEGPYSTIEEIDEPYLLEGDSAYARLVREHKLDNFERLMLILTLAPHIRPQVLDFFYTRNSTYDRAFTEFGGIRDNSRGGFLPTVETLLFLVAGDDLTRRIRLQTHLFHESALTQLNIILVGPAGPNEPETCGSLTISDEYRALLTTGESNRPDYSTDFPASRVTTNLDWDDLILDFQIMEEVKEIKTWIDNSTDLLQNPHLKKYIKPGYRALFYGPPGTGKTLTAGLLGKSTGLDVYRIDLSMIVSKYIGETEKNLGRVFDLAERRHWILFFDEADALFGKRTETNSSNDRHANQEVAFLLQRMENFPGVIVLATNLKDNIDEAFARRFQSMIYFPAPNALKRAQLWRQAFNGSVPIDPKVDFDKIAERFAISGALIMNVLRSCVMINVNRQRPVTSDDIVTSLKREFHKEGKTIEEVEKQTQRQNR